MKWLTPEEAVTASRLSVTSEELIKYTLQPEEETIEEKFQKIGLLFDRDRWQAKKPYLALLAPSNLQKTVPIVSSTSASDSSSIDDKNFIEKDEDNTASEIEEVSEQQEEPYIFDQCTVELHLTFKPDDAHADGRIIIISASSHGDFPVSETIRESSLGELPPPVKKLLKELVADFPNRQVRRQITNTRHQKKKTTYSNQPRSEIGNGITPATSTESTTTGTQLTLFGI